MWRQHPSPKEHIPVSLGIYSQLKLASAFTNDEKEVWEIVAEAIDHWMRLHGPGTIPGPATGGVQWKRLFLPNGTLLRTVFNGKNYHCMVESDAMAYDGKPVSPSAFVNAVGGIRRNAWKCTWLLFPDSKEWKLADSLRTVERPRRARKPASVPRQPAATQPIEAETSHPPHAAGGRLPATGSEVGISMQRRSADKLRPRAQGHGYGTERRANGGDHMASLLREQLLPHLVRMCVAGV